jgi:hypothetical protein
MRPSISQPRPSASPAFASKVSNMIRGIGFLSRAAAIALLFSAGTIPPANPARTPIIPSADNAAAEAGEGAVTARYEVRLRKLHLVRPDLIPYPISYDVYC